MFRSRTGTRNPYRYSFPHGARSITENTMDLYQGRQFPEGSARSSLPAHNCSALSPNSCILGTVNDVWWRQLPQWRRSRWSVKPTATDGEGFEWILDAAFAHAIGQQQQPMVRIFGKRVRCGSEVQSGYLVHRNTDGTHGGRPTAAVSLVSVPGRVLGTQQFHRNSTFPGFRIRINAEQTFLGFAISDHEWIGLPQQNPVGVCL